MKSCPFVIGVVVAGLLAGAGAKRWRGHSAEPGLSRTTKRERIAPIQPDIAPTSDRWEDLADPGAEGRHSRVALWLPNASVEDIKQLWSALKKEIPPNNDLQRLVLTRWVELDVAGAREARDQTRIFWQVWTAVDPDGAVAWAKLPANQSFFDTVLSTMAETDPDRALSLMKEVGMSPNYSQRRLLFDGFVAAGRFREAMECVPPSQRRSLNGDEAIEKWGKVEPEAAFDWMVANHVSIPIINGEDQILLNILRANPEKGPALVKRMPTGAFRERLRSNYLAVLAESDPDAALEYVRSIESDATRRSLMSSIGVFLTRNHPDAALQTLCSVIASGARPGDDKKLMIHPEGTCYDTCDNPFDDFGKALMNDLPERTMDTMMALDEGERTDQTTLEFARQWMTKDAWVFSKWLAGQQPGKRRDVLASALVDAISNEKSPHFAEAAQWVGSIGDREMAGRQAAMLVAEWRWKDADGLKQYVASGKAPEMIRNLATSDE